MPDDGQQELERLADDTRAEFVRDLGHELTLNGRVQKSEGPARFSAEAVREAHATLLEKKRREILGEEEARLRTEIAAQLQQAQDQIVALAKRASRLWVAGSVLVSGSGTTLAVLAVPGNQLWIKLAVVTGSVIGTSLIARQPRS